MDYELSQRASSQIDEIIRYTDRFFGPQQTNEYINGLYYSLELLGDNPKLGREWANGKRRYIYRQHIVFYRILEDRIVVTDIRNVRQDVP